MSPRRNAAADDELVAVRCGGHILTANGWVPEDLVAAATAPPAPPAPTQD